MNGVEYEVAIGEDGRFGVWRASEVLLPRGTCVRFCGLVGGAHGGLVPEGQQPRLLHERELGGGLAPREALRVQPLRSPAGRCASLASQGSPVSLGVVKWSVR